ncbi:MAG: hypothetical protein HKN30_04210 [Sulfitobacter sp.]|nr:hypothetical protein [Sulfitobacter sp.]
MVRAVFSSWGALFGWEDDSLVGLTDLELVESGGKTTLFAVTRGDGWLSAFDVGDAAGQTRLEGQFRIAPEYLQLESTDLVFLETGEEPQLFIAGLADDALRGVRLGLDGSGAPFRGTANVSTPGWDMGHFTEVELFADGLNGIASLRGGGLVDLSFGSANSLIISDISRPGPLSDGRATDITTTTHNGQSYAFVSYQAEDTVSMFRLENGRMHHIADADRGDGLWVDRPGTMAVATTADGDRYVVVAASGSDSLSVLQVPADGQRLTAVDHLIDSLDTRFSGASHVTSVTIDGQDFILAAGNDQGISLLAMLPGGRLQPIGAMPANAEAPLRGITSLEAIVAPGGIRVWAATEAAPYLAEFNIALPNLGDTRIAKGQGGPLSGGDKDDILQGGAGADLLNGGAGNDILVDGAGEDRLTGGAGADTFILMADGQEDIIADFDVLNDRIDLSDFNPLNGIGTLSVSSRSWGAEVRFGEEVIEVRSADGGRLSGRDFTPENLIRGNRVETDPNAYPTGPGAPAPDPTPDPGPNPDQKPVTDPNPGPEDPAPDTNPAGAPPPAPAYQAAPQITLTRTTGDQVGGITADQFRTFGQNDRIFGAGGNDTIQSGAGQDSVHGGSGADDMHGGGESDLLLGGAGDDTIAGGDGDDTISGGSQDDSLEGSDGADVILGGSGFDQIKGGAQNDFVWAGSDADRVFGGDGDDWLSAGSNHGFSVDGLWGEAGNDTLFGNNGADLLNGGEGDDALDGGAGDDILFGGGGQDLLLGGRGADRLFGSAGKDQIVGDAGNDRLLGQDGNDTLWGGTGDDDLSGGQDNDVLDGGSGNDSVFGDAGNDTLLGGTGDDLLSGGAAADTFIFADNHGNDTVTDFDALGAGEELDLSALSAINEIDDILAASRQSGADTIIETGTGSSIRLLDVDRDDLDENDFVF